MDMLLNIVREIWATLLQMAPYLMLGYLIAGILSVVVRPELVQKHLGGSGLLSILKASVLGLPLPLCSCGVLPVTASLRQQGAGRGASAAFLVATPTIGVDSFMATMGLLGPVMAIYRMAMSAVLGIYGGVMANWLGRDPKTTVSPFGGEATDQAAEEEECPHCAAARAAEEAERKQAAAGESFCCCGGESEKQAEAVATPEQCCCGTARAQPEEPAGHSRCAEAEKKEALQGADSCCGGKADAPDDSASDGRAGGALGLIGKALYYGYYQLPKSISRPLLLGVVAAGLISSLVKAEVLTPFLGGGPGTILLMLAIGVPLYVCSTVAIPLALGFMALGATPGAAMMFMLVAPATNAATLGILIRMLGGRTTLVLALALMSGALAGGLILDYLWPLLGLPGIADFTTAAASQAAHAAHQHAAGPGMISVLLTVLFLAIQVNGATSGRLLSWLRGRAKPAAAEEKSCCGH